MAAGSSTEVQLPRWLPFAGLALLSLGSTVSCLPNGWSQDDAVIIQTNAAVHSLAHPWSFFTHAYWPPPFPPDLYRPLTTLSLAAQWVISSGHALLLHTVSVLLYLALVLLVFRLARRVADPTVAWVAAAWFAVLPTHVEDVAAAVNQAELIVAIIMVIVVTTYIDRRRSGSLTGHWVAGVVALYLVAMLFKESGLMLPGLLLAAEVTGLQPGERWGERVRKLRPLVLWLALAAFVVLGARNLVLAGNTKGTFTAEALDGLGLGGRTLTMLGVVPEWARLFFWPAHLRADYSPQVIVGATSWGWMQTLGVVILLATGWLAWHFRKRNAVITFGIIWIAVGLFPVSNILVATGIVLAERTLLLASIGVVISASVAIVWVGRQMYSRGSLGRIATAVGAVILLAMGLSRSFSRQMVWRNPTSLWFQTLIDAPKSYRAHHAFAEILFTVGSQRSAEYHYRRAMELYPKAWPVDLDLADKYREAGDCKAALSLYHQVLLIVPNHSAARAAAVACFAYLGDYEAAAHEARLGASYGRQPLTFALYVRIVDSAAAVHAPPGTVALPAPVDSAKFGQ